MVASVRSPRSAERSASRVLTLVLSACAFVSVLASPAVGTAASDVQQKPRHSVNGFTGAEAAPAFTTFSCRFGKIFLMADEPPSTETDWIGLYQGDPAETNLLAWFYVKDRSLLTDLRRGEDLYTAYWIMDGSGKWVIIDQEGPTSRTCS
jgi:hypothetical protein